MNGGGSVIHSINEVAHDGTDLRDPRSEEAYSGVWIANRIIVLALACETVAAQAVTGGRRQGHHQQ